MDSDDTDRIAKRVVLHAPREKVWRTITSTEVFRNVFSIDLSGEFSPGASLRGPVTAEGPSKGQPVELTVEQMEPGRLFSWRWHPGAPDPSVDTASEPTTLVVVSLEDHPEGTLVSVVESGFDRLPASRRASALKDNTQGWEWVLQRLDERVGAAV